MRVFWGVFWYVLKVYKFLWKHFFGPKCVCSKIVGFVTASHFVSMQIEISIYFGKFFLKVIFI